MQQRRRRRTFTPAFKAEVVERCRKGDRSTPKWHGNSCRVTSACVTSSRSSAVLMEQAAKAIAAFHPAVHGVVDAGLDCAGAGQLGQTPVGLLGGGATIDGDVVLGDGNC